MHHSHLFPFPLDFSYRKNHRPNINRAEVLLIFIIRKYTDYLPSQIQKIGIIGYLSINMLFLQVDTLGFYAHIM